jgi:hypothetical protein
MVESDRTLIAVGDLAGAVSCHGVCQCARLGAGLTAGRGAQCSRLRARARTVRTRAGGGGGAPPWGPRRGSRGEGLGAWGWRSLLPPPPPSSEAGGSSGRFLIAHHTITISVISGILSASISQTNPQVTHWIVPIARKKFTPTPVAMSAQFQFAPADSINKRSNRSRRADGLIDRGGRTVLSIAEGGLTSRLAANAGTVLGSR